MVSVGMWSRMSISNDTLQSSVRRTHPRPQPTVSRSELANDTPKYNKVSCKQGSWRDNSAGNSI